MYEAAEAGIISALDQIGDFQEDYKRIVVRDVLPDYADYLGEANLAQNLLSRGRTDGQSPLHRTSDYMETFRRLRTITEKLDAGRDDCNAVILKQKDDSRKFYLRVFLPVAVSLLVLIAGIVWGS